MFRRFLGAVAVAAVCTQISLAQAAPIRAVKGNVVFSSADPSARIVVPQAARYVGTDAWLLYGIATCQLFVFAQPGARRRVGRLYWVQFEAYVPSMPKLHHHYTSARHATLGGLDFYLDTWIEENDKPGAHASDVAPIAGFLRSKGYAVPAGINSGSDEQHVEALLAATDDALPPATASVRLAHLLDVQARKELMIIYSEDIAGSGLTAADTSKGARSYARWKTFEAGLIHRAETSLTVAPFNAGGA